MLKVPEKCVRGYNFFWLYTDLCNTKLQEISHLALYIYIHICSKPYKKQNKIYTENMYH